MDQIRVLVDQKLRGTKHGERLTLKKTISVLLDLEHALAHATKAYDPKLIGFTLLRMSISNVQSLTLAYFLTADIATSGSAIRAAPAFIR